MGKYTNIEYERRFLLKHLPENILQGEDKEIEDWYIQGSMLRLRKTIKNQEIVFKLTQKRESVAGDRSKHELTTIYIDKAIFEQLKAKLPGIPLYKTRKYFQRNGKKLGVDVITLQQKQILILEVEFKSAEELLLFEFPALDITHDYTYSGYQLAILQHKKE